MSLTSTPSPSVTVEPSSTPSASQTTSLFSTQYSLYLYTFLVTLILLFLVAGGIVLRAYIVRRRNRQFIQDAVRNGTYVSPNVPTKRPKLGEKPILHDVSVTLGAHTEHKWPITKDALWEDLMPVSINLVQRDSVDPEKALSQDHTHSTSRLLALFRRVDQQILHSPPNGASSSAPQPHSRGPSSLPASSSDGAVDVSKIMRTSARVAVLVEMPTARCSSRKPKQNNELPSLEFGVMQILVKGQIRLGDVQGSTTIS